MPEFKLLLAPEAAAAAVNAAADEAEEVEAEAPASASANTPATPRMMPGMSSPRSLLPCRRVSNSLKAGYLPSPMEDLTDAM